MDKQEWNGEGLPPAGIECEGHVQDTARQWRWVAVEVLMRKEHECAVHVPSMGVLRWCDEFRPIRSAEDMAVEAMTEVMTQDRRGVGVRRFAELLYRAGYRKIEE